MQTLFLLSVGCDPELMKVRSLVIRRAGYGVREALSLTDALEIFEAGDFEVVIICHTIPEPDRLRLIDSVRRASPSVKVLIIWKDSELSAQLADQTVHSLDGPEALIKAIQATLSV